MARVLGRLRISRDTEASTAIEGQRRDIQRWADLHGHTIVGWAEDISVSGGVDPFETAGLGPWLDPEGELFGRWDMVVSWKLDRLGRGLFDLVGLYEHLDRHGKSLACVLDNIDLSTSMGRFVFVILAGVAEMEREAIQTRIREQRARTRTAGAYNGGFIPFGYRKQKRADDNRWILVPDPEQAQIVNRIFDAVTRQSVRSLCSDLNAEGIPAPKGGKWGPSTITAMVRSRHCLGYVLHRGEVVRDENGDPVMREPLVTEELWRQANDSIGKGLAPRKKNGNALLTSLATCDACGQAMFAFRQTVKGKQYSYYRCRGVTGKHGDTTCRAKALRMADVDFLAEQTLLQVIGDGEITERVRVNVGNSKRVQDLNHLIADVTSRMAKPGADIPALAAELTALSSERDELLDRGDSWEYRSTGETYRQAWARMGVDDRRNLLLRTGIRFILGRDGKNTTVELRVPADVRLRLGIA